MRRTAVISLSPCQTSWARRRESVQRGFLLQREQAWLFIPAISFKFNRLFSPSAGPKSPGKGVLTRGEAGFLKARTGGKALAPPGGVA